MSWNTLQPHKRRHFFRTWVWKWGQPESGHSQRKIESWLVVWSIFYFPIFSHILGIIIPTDVHIFRRGGWTTNQKVNRGISGLQTNRSQTGQLVFLSSCGRNTPIFAWWSSKNSECCLDFISVIRITGHYNDCLLMTVYYYIFISSHPVYDPHCNIVFTIT